MFCPACKTRITEATSGCRSCGQSFGNEIDQKLRLYFILTRELENLTSSSQNLDLQIRSLRGKILEYQQEIQSEIEKSASSPKKEVRTTLSEGAQHREKLAAEKSLYSKPQDVRSFQKIDQTIASQKSNRNVIDSEFRFGQKWLLIIGIVTVIFGVAFFLKYSFERGWIGPAGRVSLAFLWGLLFLVVGHLIRKKSLTWFGLSIYGGGIAILYFAAYAAFQIYHLLPQGPCFSIMVLITILACATAMVYQTQALAILGLIGGFLTPILMSSGRDNYIVLFIYMTILNLGILVVSFRKHWTVLHWLGFAVTYAIYGLWYVEKYAPEKFWAAVLFLNGFYIIYSLAPFAYYFIRKEAQQLSGFYILILNSVVALAFDFFLIHGKYPLEWVSVITVFYAVLFLLFAQQLSRQGESGRKGVVVMLLKSTLFLILTIPLLFSRHWITIFWILLSALLLVGGKKLGQKNFVLCALGLYFLVLVKFLFYDLSFVFQYDMEPTALHIKLSYGHLIFERWITMALIIGAPYFMRSISAKEIEHNTPAFSFPSVEQLSPVLLGISGTLLFFMLTLEISAYFHESLPQARFASLSVIWAIFSIVLMIVGFRKNSDRMRKIALGLLFFTTFKVFLFDIRNIRTPYRILSFIVLGLILILISYFYNQAKGRLLLDIEGKRAHE